MAAKLPSISKYITSGLMTLKSGLEIIQDPTEFLLAFHTDYGISCLISEIKRDVGQISQYFHSPHAFDAPGLSNGGKV